jgi:hypothetical protein
MDFASGHPGNGMPVCFLFTGELMNCNEIRKRIAAMKSAGFTQEQIEEWADGQQMEFDIKISLDGTNVRVWADDDLIIWNLSFEQVADAYAEFFGIPLEQVPPQLKDLDHKDWREAANEKSSSL